MPATGRNGTRRPAGKAWTCPKCERTFGRTGQSHECAPAMPLEEYFSTGPAHERPIYDVVVAHLRSLGPIEVEPVSIGLFFKVEGRKVAELRSMTKWFALGMSLPERPSLHRTMRRKPQEYQGRWYVVANLTEPADFDDTLAELLTTVYLTAFGR